MSFDGHLGSVAFAEQKDEECGTRDSGDTEDDECPVTRGDVRVRILAFARGIQARSIQDQPATKRQASETDDPSHREVHGSGHYPGNKTFGCVRVWDVPGQAAVLGCFDPPVDCGGPEELVLPTTTQECGGQAENRENGKEGPKDRLSDREQHHRYYDTQDRHQPPEEGGSPLRFPVVIANHVPAEGRHRFPVLGFIDHAFASAQSLNPLLLILAFSTKPAARLGLSVIHATAQ